MTNYRAIILVFALLTTPFISHAADPSKPSQSILIVHSYHQGFRWTDSIMEGMLDVLQKEAPDAGIHVEYLDSKRLPQETFNPLFDEILRRKFSTTTPTVILVSDDAAFDLMLALRDKHYPGVPLVFCGVNNFNDERLAGHMAVTGVTEDFDIKGTVEIALKLHPNAKHMAVISDSTETGEINRQRFLQAAPEFSDRVDIFELFDLSTEELSSQLKSIPEDSFILNLSFFRDRLGQSYSTREGNHIVASLSDLPIYSCWDYFLDGDAVGGLVVSGRQQGEASALMAAKVLKGLEAEDIPILRESPNVYMFDYGVMERFGIREAALPKGSVVINKSQTLFSQYGIWVIGFLLIGGIQTFLILALLHHRNRSKAANDALRESEERFRALFAAVSDPVLVAERDTGILVECNEAAERYFGRSREQIIGLAQHELHSPETLRIEGVTEDFKRQVTAPGLVNNVRFMAAGGIVRLADVSASAFEIGDNRLILGVFRDVTEQRQADEALRGSEDLLNASQRLSKVGGWEWNLETQTMYWTEETYRIHEFEPDKLGPGSEGHINRSLECYEPEARIVIRAAFQLCVKEGQPYDLELPFTTAKGHRLWVRTTARPVFESGKVIRVIGNIMDITDRKRTEVMLRETADRLRLANKATNDVIWDWDVIQDTQRWNEVGTAVFGWTEIVEQPVNALWWVKRVHPDDRERVHNSFFAVLNNPELDAWHDEYRFRKADGTDAIVLDRGYVLRDDQGKAIRMIGAMQDITDRKRAEEALLLAKEAAEAANHAKSAFLANMSHEIRTPLNGVLGMLQLIQTSEDLAEVEMYAEMGIRAGQRLTSLLGDILDLSRIEAGRMPIASNSFALADVFTALAETFSPMNYSKGLPLVIKPSPDIPTYVIGDDVRVRQILFNLVGNAMKFTAQGEVVVEVSTLQPHPSGMARLLFIVSDTGIGIPDEKIDQICAPFTQVSEDFTRSHQGAGLGLAIALKLIDAMGGTLAFDSTEGQGTSVYLVLPFSIPGYAAIPTTPESIPDTNIPASLRLLLVEDDEVCRASARLTLEKMGYHVVTAKNGAEALDALRETSFDCVLMDVQMDVLDGVEATRQIRSGNAGVLDTQIPIIAMTAFAMTGDREKFLEAGMNDYIAKPVQVAELKKALERVAEKLGKGGVHYSR
ncbi:MAG: PAS domain S-box protein [Desulfomicrobium sp.]|nr:PAS domain S-box protein [Pseudomonadota bacterium]MBU4572570.1 PAS domain S-box protein [Pseudomonadota bacterium]MBU4595096.1 PAS domain S-box protein [Pseudomonadota bacterium]MBV1719410.1 PAS domain S-box protein [Desulfomicrobium sp.]MBV1749122.1 PAS domain S-box protein [Desulfomicrobium sp.]